MTTGGDVEVHEVRLPSDDARLGRHVAHDPRSLAYGVAAVGDGRPALSFRHRIIGPRRVPQQRIGCCTGVDQCVRADAVGNRVRGVVLGMSVAERLYQRATVLDTFPGTYPPVDTGSSSLYAGKAMVEAGFVERYEWILRGVDQLLAVLRQRPVGLGTKWTRDMFNPSADAHVVDTTGPVVGGHQWSAIGYDSRTDAVEGLCWWGPGFGDHGVFRIRVGDLAPLLEDDGDGQVTYRTGANA